MAPLLLALGVFIVGAVLVVGVYCLHGPAAGPDRSAGSSSACAMCRRHRSRNRPSLASSRARSTGVLPALDRIAPTRSTAARLARLIEQSGAKTGVSTVLMSALVLAPRLPSR